MDTAVSAVKDLATQTEDPPSRKVSWWMQILRHIAAVLGYLLFMEIGAWMPIGHSINESSVFLLWPATGFALAITVRGGYSYLGAFVATAIAWHGLNLPFGWLFAVERGVAIAISVGFTSYMLRRFLKDYAMEAIRDVFVFLALGPIMCGLLLAALTSVILCAHVDEIPWFEFNRLLTPWWLAEAVGILVLAPFALVWTGRTKINWRNRQIFEVFIWLIVLLGLAFAVFDSWAPTDTLKYPLELAMFPVVFWGGIRFGQRGATAGVVIIAIMAIWEILQVLGPTQKYISTPPEFIWVFVGILSATTFFLAAIITEVLRSEEKAASNEQHLQAFIDALPDAAFIVSANGKFLEVFAAQRSGAYQDIKSWQGKHIADFWEADLAAAFHDAISKVLRTGEAESIEYPLRHDNEEFWFEGRLAPMRENTEMETLDGIIWVAYEITARKRAQEDLELRDRVLQGVAEATNALLASKDLNEGVGSALDCIGRYAQVDSIRLVASDPEREQRRSTDATPWRWTNAPFAKLTRNNDPSLNWNELPDEWTTRLANGEVVQHSAATPGKMSELMNERKIKSVLLAPVFVDGEFWGAFELCDDNPRAWNDSEIASLSVAAGSLGSFIQSRRGEEQLRKAKEDADRANMAKGEFLAMMSHEIRTPMNAVLGYTDLLAQTQVDDQQREWLAIVNRSGKALLELINNILDYSKIESRGVELEYQEFSLEQTVMEALELILVKANQKGVKINYEFKGESEDLFLGDSHRLRQILLNLVNNAVKFTEKGSVDVIVAVKDTEQLGRCRVDVAVKDTGVGIPKDKVQNLFQPFSQADSSTTRRFGGTGLGLVISKRLVEKMGGDIVVESEDGKGSTFSFHVFLNRGAASPKPTLLPNQKNTPLAVLAPLTILVVEDEPVNQQLTRDILNGMGYTFKIAADEDEAVKLIAEHKFNCVLMDIQLPGKSGLDITRDIRDGKHGEQIAGAHIIAVTANALPGDRKKCLDAGANDYLSKPLALEELTDSLILASQKRTV
ncbi:ATP-binding protein [Cerasicoccus fimbriatus]|uniref:ATP-binding protein n=1 Tax=Cerasicoccus fimbriatus TaxID=3014554 RepID=UPI0022B5E35D|nr:ATP-binding protein [Cerasicoccus sp. TK19100]